MSVRRCFQRSVPATTFQNFSWRAGRTSPREAGHARNSCGFRSDLHCFPPRSIGEIGGRRAVVDAGRVSASRRCALDWAACGSSNRAPASRRWRCPASGNCRACRRPGVAFERRQETSDSNHRGAHEWRNHSRTHRRASMGEPGRWRLRKEQPSVDSRMARRRQSQRSDSRFTE